MTAVLTISILFFLCYTALLIYYRQSWLSIPDFKSQTTNHKPQTKITVIIPARNEEENIAACLDSICNQSYPKELFEVLVVDDHSTDKTAEIILSYQPGNIKLISLKDLIGEEKINSYKKRAIETAIQQSTGDLIVTTDADCIVKENWLQTIAAFYEQYQPAFIAMPVEIKPAASTMRWNSPQGKFIQIFQSLDFMVLQGITGASVRKKIHSMCNGANLAYTKKAFEEVGGFSGIDHIASGDDMLLMHKIYKRYTDKVLFLRSKEAIVQTQPVHSVKEFFNQRIRWASKAGKYDDKRIIIVLVLVYLVNVLLLVLPVVAVFDDIQFTILNACPSGRRVHCSMFGVSILLLLLKTVVELFFLYPVARFFNNQKMLWLFPLMQPFHIIYTVIAGWLGSFGSYSWKERRVK